METSLPSGRRRILVVDDEPLLGTVVRRMLATEYDVVTKTSAVDALELLKQDGGFDLVLCDLMMPEMSGMELYEHLRDVRPQLAERMVFLTGGAFTSDARSFLDRVPNPRLDKPFDAKLLRATVHRLVPPASGTQPGPPG